LHDFSFTLTKIEWEAVEALRSQNLILKRGGNRNIASTCWFDGRRLFRHDAAGIENRVEPVLCVLGMRDENLKTVKKRS
jgi:hypothetical protein